MDQSNNIDPRAGLISDALDLINVSELLQAYESEKPDPNIASQRIAFGTSGHRGSSLSASFNENHILALSQAICGYRQKHPISGPLFLGFDSHALSLPAFRTSLEVFAANGVNVMISSKQEFTPTPVISHAILNYNKGRTSGLADGVVITPSHNPPAEGGFKYNATHGGPAEKEITDWIQNTANEFLREQLKSVKRIPYDRALKSPTTQIHDYVNTYVQDLQNVLDMDVIRESKIHMGVDPLGGAGIHYWGPISDFYKLNLKITNSEIDPCFRFMTRDWDGKIRMDPSSAYAMQSLIDKGKHYDISFACDTDHDRHGIVCKTSGLMPANHYLSAMVSYLFQNRPEWPKTLQVGKTVVSSSMLDRVAEQLGRRLYEVPVGFKWFVDGLLHAHLGFGGEESAGASFLRKDGEVWSTDKDGIICALLSAEITAKTGKDPSQLYQTLTETLGNPVYKRIDVHATKTQKEIMGKLSADQIKLQSLGGDTVKRVSTQALGNQASIGGIKIETQNGWLAARPSGTEEIYKVYAESYVDEAHLERIIQEGTSLIHEKLESAGGK